MTTRERLIRELDDLPEPVLEKVVDLIRAFREKADGDGAATAYASESALGRDWLRPEEDEAWKDL